jgi:hypothetical protein
VEGDADILESVRAAFAGCPRPEHFTNHTHCQECAEYDEFLRARTPDTLHIEDVGTPGTAMCFVDPVGFAYFFPGLARLALDDAADFYGWYPRQLLFHLACEWEKNRHLHSFSPDQRHTVADLLRHLVLTRAEQIDKSHPYLPDEFLYAIEMWSGEPGA